MRDRYTFDGISHFLHVAPREEPAPARSMPAGLYELEFLLADPRNLPECERLLADLGLPSLRAGVLDTGERTRVLDRLRDRLASYSIVRVDRHLAIVPVRTVADQALGPADEADETEAWIEIQVVDEDGKPLSNVEYRIVGPDEGVRTGTTDSKGRAREEGLVPGQCKVSFPKIDASMWAKS